MIIAPLPSVRTDGHAAEFTRSRREPGDTLHPAIAAWLDWHTLGGRPTSSAHPEREYLYVCWPASTLPHIRNIPPHPRFAQFFLRSTDLCPLQGHSISVSFFFILRCRPAWTPLKTYVFVHFARHSRWSPSPSSVVYRRVKFALAHFDCLQHNRRGTWPTQMKIQVVPLVHPLGLPACAF